MRTPAERRTLARLRLCRMVIKRNHWYLPRDPQHYVPAAKTCVRKTWERHGYIAPSVQREAA